MRSLAALLLVASVAVAAEPTKLAPYTKPTLVAHRGASGEAPEHTTAAYELAIKHGANFVEPDVQLTRDGVLVCVHDATLERTTNVAEVFPDRAKEVKGKKTWPVVEFTLEEVQTLDAGAWKGKKFAGQKVLTLQQAIDAVKGKCGLLIETKHDPAYAKLGLSMEKELVKVLKANKLDRPGADPKTPVVIQSFSAASLKATRKEGCTLPQAFLTSKGDWPADELKAVKEYADGFAPSKEVVLKRPEVVKDAHALGMSVSVWTFRAGQTGRFKTVAEEMKHFLTELNVDAVITDHPDQFPRE